MSPGVLRLLLVSTLAAPPASAAIPRADVERAAAGVRKALDKDRGKLWGVPLDGPILFVDAGTHEVVATAPDSAGQLQKVGTLWIGLLPQEINPANTAVDWAGRRWTMIVWPLPSDEFRQRALLIHELWHRIQNQIGLPMTAPSNRHLDQPEGRLWLQLEWRALARALEGSGRERKEAVADALTFRAVRRARFPGAAGDELALERNEGLAEYTGARLAHPTRDGAVGYAQVALANANRSKSFVRSFAYVTGPAYGILLDQARPKWRRELGTSADLADLLGAGMGLPLPDTSAAPAIARAGRYDYAGLAAAERERQHQRQEKLAELRRRFVEGPVLRIPIRKGDFSFDPHDVQPLDELGTVYATLRLSDEWGVLETTGGGLIAGDFSAVTVPAPVTAAGDSLSGPGWTLALGGGWELRPAERAGCFELSAKK